MSEAVSCEMINLGQTRMEPIRVHQDWCAMRRFFYWQASAWPIRFGLGCASGRLLVPERVGLGDQLMAVENCKNANLVADGLVDDAVRLDDQLAQAIDERRDLIEAFRRDVRAGVGEVGEGCQVVVDLESPANGVVVRQLECDGAKDARELVLGVKRPVDVHAISPRAFRSSSISCMFRMTSSWGMNSPFSNCCREIETERESSIRSIKSSKSPALMMYEAARPFCVTRTGRCVWLTLAMIAEKLLRHSENGTVSSEGRQRLMGSSAVIGMVEIPFNGRYCTKSCADRQWDVGIFGTQMTSSYANLAKWRVSTTPTSSATPQRHFAKVDVTCRDAGFDANLGENLLCRSPRHNGGLMISRLGTRRGRCRHKGFRQILRIANAICVPTRFKEVA